MSLRERKKVERRAQLLDIAHRLFHEKGFANTTIEEICDEAMISKRTFFRYFPDKESLVFPNRDERLEQFVRFLGMHSDVDNPFDALRDATRLFSSRYNENKDKILAQQALIQSSQSLLARERAIDRDWEAAIAAAFAARSEPGPETELWSAVLAGAVMGVVRATMRCWFAGDCERNLGELGLTAIDCLEQGFPKRMVV